VRGRSSRGVLYMKRWVIACAALCALVAGTPRENAAAQVVALSLEETAKGCDVIVRGTVVDKTTAWTSNGAMIETTYTVECAETLKGAIGVGSQIEIVVQGGDMGNLSIRASESATYAQGEEVVVFGRARQNGGYDTYGCFQGKFTLLGGMVREMLNTNWSTFRAQIVAALN
jgi:hypothetical protein